MKTKFILFIFLLTSSLSQAQIYDTLQGNITSPVTLTNNKIWVLRGFVRVQPGGVLNIPANTLIFGYRQGTNIISTLIIEMGGRIYAQGTASQPIIFTSSNPPGSRNIGDWGGVVICGRARINTVNGTDTSAIIEGSIGSYYGGTNDADNSGILRYVRIEFAGANLSTISGNELNGLTMGGVGSGTVIEYVQVSYGFDDAFEWFGGTVNCRYLVAYKNTDDDFDVDNGFRGRLQFGLSVKDKFIADISGSNGIESDNNANTPNNFNTPRTKPIFSNFTFIGPKADTNTVVNPDHKRGYHLRRNCLTSTYNSIVMGFPDAILFDGAGVTCAAQNDTLQVRNMIFAGNPGGFKVTGAACGFSPTAWINTGSFSNRVFASNSQVMLNNPFGDSSYLNPMPSAGSPALTGADFSNPNLAGFEQTTYVGAFGSNNWMYGWVSFTPQSNQYIIGIEPISNEIPATFRLEQNYPNPFNPSTKIRFDIPQSNPLSGEVSQGRGGFVRLSIHNILGQEVAVLVNENLKPGKYEIEWNASNYPSGVYFYRLVSSSFTQTRKMLLIK